MSRRSERRAQEAAEQANAAALASEAGRVLQQRAQERQAQAEPQSEPPNKEIVNPVETRDEPRRLALEEIEEREAREREKEAAQPAPEVTPEPEPAPEPAPEPVAAAPEPAPEPVPEMVKVKVDGEEFEVAKAEVDEAGGVKAYQIMRAADNRLKKANEIVAHNRQLQEQITQLALRSLQTPQQVAPQTTPEQWLQKLAAARFGTDDEFASAVNQFVSSKIPQFDQNAVITQATTNMRYDIAWAEFKKDFGDIMANPMLADLAMVQINKAMAAYTPNGTPDWQKLSQVDFRQFLSTIGTQIRSVVQRPSQPQPSPSTTTGTPSQGQTDREARKASIVNLPAVAAARASQPAEEKPMTRQEILDEAKKARGIPVG